MCWFINLAPWTFRKFRFSHVSSSFNESCLGLVLIPKRKVGFLTIWALWNRPTERRKFRREIIWGTSIRECCAGFSKTHPLVFSGTAKLSLPEVETLETLRVTETSHKPGGLPLSRLTQRPFHCSPGSQATLRGSAALLSQVEIREVIVHDPST